MEQLELEERAVTTPLGDGRVRNVVRGAGGTIVDVIVELDSDHDRQPLWRVFSPDDVLELNTGEPWRPPSSTEGDTKT